MIAGAFGLLGVICGSLLAIFKEWWLQRLSNKRDSAYLAARVAILLDKYVLACASVVADDGLCYGQSDQDGRRRPQVKAPSFDPWGLEVEWRSIPVKLMHEILELPYKTEVAEHSIQEVKDHIASHPELKEYFDERQLQYAQLGLIAADLSTTLRQHAGLSKRSAETWDPTPDMQAVKERITKQREQQV